MKTKTLDHVQSEVRRFLLALDQVRKIEKSNDERKRESEKTGKYFYEQTGTRKHGAMRRAAHDLKEALTLITQNRDVE